MKKLLAIIVLGLLWNESANAKYLMISKMRGTHWSFFGFSGKNVSVDVEKIGDKFYPLYYEDRQIFIEEDRVSEYFRYNNDKTVEWLWNFPAATVHDANKSGSYN